MRSPDGPSVPRSAHEAAAPHPGSLRPLCGQPGTGLRRSEGPVFFSHPRAHRCWQDQHPRRHQLRPVRRDQRRPAGNPGSAQPLRRRWHPHPRPVRLRPGLAAVPRGARPGTAGAQAAGRWHQEAADQRQPLGVDQRRGCAPGHGEADPRGRQGGRAGGLQGHAVPPGGSAAPGAFPGIHARRFHRAAGHPPEPLPDRPLCPHHRSPGGGREGPEGSPAHQPIRSPPAAGAGGREDRRGAARIAAGRGDPGGRTHLCAGARQRGT